MRVESEIESMRMACFSCSWQCLSAASNTDKGCIPIPSLIVKPTLACGRIVTGKSTIVINPLTANMMMIDKPMLFIFICSFNVFHLPRLSESLSFKIIKKGETTTIKKPFNGLFETLFVVTHWGQFTFKRFYRFISNFISPVTVKEASLNDGGPKLPLASLLKPYCSFGTPKKFLSISLL